MQIYRTEALQCVLVCPFSCSTYVQPCILTAENIHYAIHTNQPIPKHLYEGDVQYTSVLFLSPSVFGSLHKTVSFSLIQITARV